MKPRYIAVAATVLGVTLFVSTSAYAVTAPTPAQWARAANATMHTSAYHTLCVQHSGDNHAWREGFCTGDLARYPYYGTVSAPPGYTVCYIRDQVKAGEIARVALASGTQPQHNVKGC